MSHKIMVLGTGSSVGKSIFVAGLCRALSNRGLPVAPFKSQNMSNNSYITAQGKEMGRAQVFQAQAARIEPSELMNPILLKPTTDVGSQVIVLGKATGNYTARDYFRKKESLLPIAVEAFRTLEKQYSHIILEGAGSPAEINLRSRDIVNMGFAEAIDSKVVIVGDVDRGGVFAALYGTYLLLTPEERERVAGFLINKFRGDVSLLEPGIVQISEMMGIPCLGVIPYISDLLIDDEDSANEIRRSKPAVAPENRIRIGVIRLKHISNFTDFTVFYREPDVELRYIDRAQELADLDLIVIPGSKSTIADMEDLRSRGLADALLEQHRKGVPILGICGGYQILGESIEDDEGVETNAGASVHGLGLLPVTTRMASDKRTARSIGVVESVFLTDDIVNAEVHGYEIHMGVTAPTDSSPTGSSRTESSPIRPWLKTATGTDGFVSGDGAVAGTYFHGIFDNDGFRTGLLNHLRSKRGLPTHSETATRNLIDLEYDRVAQIVEDHVDVDRLLEIMSQCG